MIYLGSTRGMGAGVYSHINDGDSVQGAKGMNEAFPIKRVEEKLLPKA